MKKRSSSRSARKRYPGKIWIGGEFNRGWEKIRKERAKGIGKSQCTC